MMVETMEVCHFDLTHLHVIVGLTQCGALFYDFFASGAVAHFHDVDAGGGFIQRAAVNVVAGHFGDVVVAFNAVDAHCANLNHA